MTGTFLTELNAQEIANIIQQFYSEGDSRGFFGLALTRDGQSKEMWVRPHLCKAPETLENGSQLILCESNDGYTVSITIPLRRREYVPAMVVLGMHSGVR